MYSLGLHLEGSSLKAALLHRKKDKTEIVLLQTIALADNVKPLYILEAALKEKKFVTVTGLEGWEVLVRDLFIKLARKRAVKAVLPFQIESLLPHRLDDLILIPFLYPQKGGTEAIIYAATQTSVRHHLEKMAALDLNPDIVSSTSNALLRFSKHFFPAEKNHLFFHMGWQKCLFGIVSDGRLNKSQSIGIGLSHFIAALQQDNPDITLEEVDLKHIGEKSSPQLHQTIGHFRRELERGIAYLKGKISSETLPPFLVTGSPAANDLLEAAPINPFGISESYAIPIGLALEGLYRDENTLQFRQGPFVSPKTVEKKRRQIGIYASACLLLWALIWGGGHLAIKQKEAGLLGKLKTVYAKSPDHLKSGLASWENQLSKQKKAFPYFPSVPNVSEVIAWISAHPQLKGAEVKRFNYSLIKYPKLEGSQDPYRARVELEFKTPTPKIAREFRNALMTGDAVVDAKNEITWNVHQDTYRTTFLLKSKSL